MEINWFTVVAQIVNFLILVWLLKRFLYKPVLNAIDEREKKISGQLNDAEATKAAAEKEHVLFAEKNKLFEQERADKMNKAVEEITAEKTRLLEDVRKESDALSAKYEASLKEQEKNMAETLRNKTTEEVFAIAGKTLGDLANASLEEQVIQLFLRKVQSLDSGQKEELKHAFNDAQKTNTIRSAFKLSTASKKELEKVIEGITGQENKFSYEVAPALVSGIEIDTKSYQLSWNIDAYLQSLKTTINTKEKEHALL